MMQQTVGFIAGQEWMFIIIIGIIIAVVVSSIIKKIKKRKEGIPIGEEDKPVTEITNQNDKAMRILKQRLAKGEITKEEYDELKKEFEP
jgi:uncharacterized membrane protein